MTDESMPHITAAELRIMKALWKLGSGTVRQVLEELPAKGGEKLAYTTVMTMMKQLADRGALDVDRQRQPFIYTPTVEQDQVLGSRVSHFLQSVFDGQAEALVSHLVEQADLSPQDLRRIKDKIRKRAEAEKREGGNS